MSDEELSDEQFDRLAAELTSELLRAEQRRRREAERENEHLRSMLKASGGTNAEAARAIADLVFHNEGFRNRVRRLEATARQLVGAAKAWTRANSELTSPEVRQKAIDDLADAVDAFDALLGSDWPVGAEEPS